MAADQMTIYIRLAAVETARPLEGGRRSLHVMTDYCSWVLRSQQQVGVVTSEPGLSIRRSTSRVQSIKRGMSWGYHEVKLHSS